MPGRGRRAAAAALAVPALLATASCGNFTDSSSPPPSPFPESKRPLLQRQAGAIREVVDGLAGGVPAEGRTARTVLADDQRECRFRDPDSPGRAPAVLGWVYTVRLEYSGRDGAAVRDAALKDRLRRDGWTLGDDGGTLIAVRKGTYLEIRLSSTTGRGGTMVIGGFSRCVRADGRVVPADPPVSPATGPAR